MNKCNDCGHVHEEYHRVWSEEEQKQTYQHPEGMPDIICCPKCDSTNISIGNRREIKTHNKLLLK